MNIDPKELRIGNLVKCTAIGNTYSDRNPYYGESIFSVYSACKDFVKLNLGHDAIQKVEILEVEPIELTEEWLIKFGFENNFKQYELMNWGLKVDLLNNEWIVFHGFCGKYSEITSCRYVHQLQNLYFTLTGKELTLTNV